MSLPLTNSFHPQESGISVFVDGPMLATPSVARLNFELLAPQGTNLIIVIGNSTGAISDAVTAELIKRMPQIPALVLSSNHFREDGIQSIEYTTQRVAHDAGAVFVKDVNFLALQQIIDSATIAISEGLRGDDLKQRLVNEFGVALDPTQQEQTRTSSSSRNEVEFPLEHSSLQPIFDVGPSKFVGMVKINPDISDTGLRVEDVVRFCLERGLSPRVFSGDENALVVYDHDALQEFLNLHAESLEEEGLKPDADSFVHHICTKQIDNPVIYGLAARAFADVRVEAEAIPPVNLRNIPAGASNRQRVTQNEQAIEFG